MNPIASAVFSLAFGFVFLFLIALPGLLLLLFAGLQWGLARRSWLLALPLPLITGLVFLLSFLTSYPRWSFLTRSCCLFLSAGAFAGTMLGCLFYLLERLIRQLREF